MYHTWHKWLAAQLYDNEENVAKCRQISHLLRIFSQRLALGLPHLTSFQSHYEAAQLYNNDGNATECIKMQQFLGKLSNSLLSAIPRLISAIPSS